MTPSDATIQRAIDACLAGHSPKRAAALVGVALYEWNDWLDKGLHAPWQHPTSRFRRGVEQATMDATVEKAKEEEELRKSVLATARGVQDGEGEWLTPPDWKAAAWLLERRHGYARPAPLEPIKIEVADSRVGTAMALADLLDKAAETAPHMLEAALAKVRPQGDQEPEPETEPVP